MITIFFVADTHAQAALMAQTFETFRSPWQDKEFFDQGEFGRAGDKYVFVANTDETFGDYALNAMQFMRRTFGFELGMSHVAPGVFRIMYRGRVSK